MWQLPNAPANEEARLEALESCGIMDTPRDERFDRISRLAQRFYSADVAFISFVDANYQWMKSVTSSEIASSIERRRSVCQHVIHSGAPLVVADLKSDPAFDGHPVVPHLSLRFYAGMPILLKPGLAIGTICVLRHQPGIEPGFDIEPLRELAAIAADEVEMQRMNHELRLMSRVDILTGLGNRRDFNDELARAEQRCRRTGEPLSLLLIDVDHFKALNDTMGHQAGDEALHRIGGALRDGFMRKDDTIARYGGEEFIAILPGSTLAGARLVAERIRSAVAAAAIAHPRTGTVTVSIGIGSQQGPGIDSSRLVAEADAALYDAKGSGRNRVAAHETAEQLFPPAERAGRSAAGRSAAGRSAAGRSSAAV